MSKELIEKKQIHLLPNSYYALYSETKGFFNPKVNYDHCFYIGGEWRGLGFYGPDSHELYTSFVKLLNSGFSKKSSFYRNYVHNSTCMTIVKAIHHLVPHKITYYTPQPIVINGQITTYDGKSFWILEFWNQLGLNDVGQLNNMRVHKFVLNGTNLTFILSNQEKVDLKITEEEYIFIRDFIKMSFLVFLPSMVHRICFEINSDTSCIETAIERGWIQ